ncbi:MAG TPA: hypothetical protein VF939_24890 [Puia sp.]
MLRTTNSLPSQAILDGSKKLVFIIAMLLTVDSSFAIPGSITAPDSFITSLGAMNNLIRASFRKDFKKAELMGYEASRQYTKLIFRMNDMVLFAFYSDNGELLAVTRNIRSNQLPISLLLELKKDYNDYWISDLFELYGEGQNSYYITIENADKKITLRSGNNTSWELYERRNKK